MTSRDFRTSALHDVDMAGMPVHIAAGRVGGANEAQLLDADTASGLQETPGLGVDIDEELAARYPYRPASLPVNRLEDGTMHSW